MNVRSLFAVAVIILLTTTSLLSKELDTKTLPSRFSATNAGTEFYFSFPPCYEEESGANNSCRVFVASLSKQLITIEVPGRGYRVTKLCQANDVVEFVLGTGAAQPFLKSGKANAPEEQVYQGAAIHVIAQSPIICYGVTRYNYTSDGFLAVPVSALGDEYIVASYPQYTALGSGYQLTSETTISAAYDDTEVTFEMGGNSISETSGGLKPGKTKSFVLQHKGDVLCFSSNGDIQDLSGSRITSTKPVAVVSGNQCANVPAGVYACDYMSEMELPTFTWGTEYHVTPFWGRKNNPVIRIYAKEKDTKVYRDGQEWFTLSGATRKIDEGYADRRSSDGVPRAVVISADKPIYVEELNPGQSDDNVASDPFMLVLSPLQQYQKEIVWCTPGAITSNNNFKSHYVNLIYQLSPNDSIPDDLEFAISVNGQFEWKKVSEQFGSNTGLIFSVPVNDQKYACKQIKLPGDNVYRLRAATPISAYCYGFSNYDSYGMPAGGGLQDLITIDTLKPNPTWTMESNGSVGNGLITDSPDNTTFRSNLGLIYMDNNSSSNYQFSYDSKKEFIAGKTQTTDWNLKVINPDINARAVLVFSDRAGNDTTILVEYKSFGLTIDAKDTIDFGVLKRGQGITMRFYITNTTTAPISLERLELKDNTKGFFVLLLPLPVVIAPSSSSPYVYADFSNNQVGVYIDQIGIGTSNQFAYKNYLKAEIADPVIVASDYDYGTKTVGTRTSSLQIQIKNTGKADLVLMGDDHLTALAGTPFEVKNWPMSYPLLIKRDDSVAVTVDFVPVKEGTFSAKIHFSSDAVLSDSVVELRGSSIMTDVTETEAKPSGILTKLTPQPTSGTATLTLTMPSSQIVSITIINMLGQRVGTIVEYSKLEAGEHTFPIPTEGYSSGNYSISIQPENGEPIIQAMTIVR
ncbi:MAG: choice-of-anchor D domain-containing protein [Bacteroidetes bacterium]|nr:choice-of-anchor D domain-containing protein [Bacteroidota bacterium]